MERHSLHLDDIQVGERHRALSAPAVDRLAASMKEMGLLHPIAIRLATEEIEVDGRMVSGVPVLVAGYHRYSAARQLGWSHIDCVEVDDNAIQAEMWEIAENLHRLDLTPAQRDEHLRRYAELAEARRRDQRIVEQNVKQLVGRPKSIVTEVSEQTGVPAHTVRRALNPKPVTEVIPLAARSQEDAILMQANAIVAAWNRAIPEAREIAMDQMEGGPVFDRSRAAR